MASVQEQKKARRTAGKEPDAAAWLDQHGDAMYRYALLRVADASTAEDLVQDALLAAIQAYKRFKGDSSERTWLISILKRKIIDHIRRLKREGRQVSLKGTAEFVDLDFTAKGLWGNSPKKWGRDPAKAFEDSEFWEAITNCLSLLPLRLLYVFTEREMEDRSTEAICKDLDVTATNLWTLLHRARTRLRKCLEVNWFARGSS